MEYQLFPPVKSIAHYPGACNIKALGNPRCSAALADSMFASLPQNLQPQYQAKQGVFCYEAGQVTAGAAPMHKQGYVLHIGQEGIWICAADAAGLQYGLDTLQQILTQAGEEVMCMEIVDYPSMEYRGLMLDVSRGKVYTRAYLLELAEMLSKMRYNVLQLYIEHTFDFQKHPEICEGSDPITAADILALQQRCKELGIELQANLQCLGHCRRILTRKEHMHLSESEMFWSLCTTSQDALNLIDDMFSEYLPLFESQWVNICFDEPYDIGKGKSAPLGKDGSVLYVEFLNKVHDLAAKYGKKIMFFGDVIVRHPEYLPTLPKDVRYLDWCYDPKPYFGTPAVFDRYHLDYWVSPGSGNWNTLFPRLDGCLANVNQLLKEGFAANAGGMLFTDWNDHGGYTQPGAGYYGYGYAAAVAWAGEAQNREKADAYLDRILDLPGYSQVIQTLAKIYQIPPIWSKNRSQCVMALFDEPIFGQAIRGPEPPAGLKAYDLTLPEGVQTVLERHSQHPLRPYFSIPEAVCTQIADVALQGKKLAANLPLSPIRDQLLYQANAFLLMTDKLALSRKIIARFETEDLTVEDMVLLEEELRVLIQRYVHLQLDYIKTWMQVARVSEIDISLTYFAHIIERLDYLRDWISLQREDLCAGKEICRDFSNYQTAGYGTLPTY